jgi:archaeosortase A (PGF-CTERM-specific)
MIAVESNGLLVASGVLLAAGAAAYRVERSDTARWSATGGFLLLGTLMTVFLAGYATSSRGDRLFLVTVSGAGTFVAFHGAGLVFRRWERDAQLTTTVAAVLLIVLPFELFPGLVVAVQESLAHQVVFMLEAVGYQPALEYHEGIRSRIRFENGGHYYVARECTGIEGVALFGGILVGARANWRQKLEGIIFMLVAVYVVNILRLIFVGAAMGGDWFGPLLTDEETVQMTYYVAEVAIGQTAVIVASIAGFLFVSRWIPDLTDFADDLLSSFISYGTGVTDRLRALQ